ncbi:MAG: OsmC family protein [Pseudomonadota bacterium]
MSSATPIVMKVDASPEFTKFQPTVFQKPRMGDQMTFEVNVAAESMDGMLKKATVEPNLPTWGAFQLICDEGGALGGTDTAPPPLGYMAAGIAFCLLTHLTAYARAKKLRLTTIKIEQRMQFITTLVTDAEAEGDFRGGCEGITTHVVVEGDEDAETVRAMVADSEASCMAMQSLMNITPKNTQMHLNGQSLGAS